MKMNTQNQFGRRVLLASLPVAVAAAFFPPKSADATAAMVAFTMRVRWPAFLGSSSGTAVQVGANPNGGGSVPFDHSKKQVLFFTGSILR